MNLKKLWNTSIPFEFLVEASLEECLERIEEYRKRELNSTNGKKIFINIEPFKNNEIYQVELGYYLLNLELELDADGETCLVTGQVKYNWFIPPFPALFLFGLYWFSSPIPLTVDNGLFVLGILLAGAFLAYWLLTMGFAGEFKLRLREILEDETPVDTDSNQEDFDEWDDEHEYDRGKSK